MAITFIYKIYATGSNSLNYDTVDKSSSIVKNDGEDSLNYVMRDKRKQDYVLSKDYLERMGNLVKFNKDGTITFKTVSTFIGCTKNNTYNQWQAVRKQSGTDKAVGRGTNKKGILQYCIVQNLGENIDPRIAHDIGVKFATRYLKGYQVVVSTHINTGYIHNHIEFNATSLSGRKYNDCRKSIQDIRTILDALCDEYGLEVLESTREFRPKHYRDEWGIEKIYEPTERKNNKLFGEVSEKASYLNTEKYKSGIQNSMTHIETIKADIDRLLPEADE